jgi:hypothetical protein
MLPESVHSVAVGRTARAASTALLDELELLMRLEGLPGVYSHIMGRRRLAWLGRTISARPSPRS